MNGDPDHLSESARQQLSDPENELYFSTASSWEIGIKVAAGKLRLPEPAEEYIPSRLARNQIFTIPIHHRHALRAASLPMIHRDPFDRMLVAQAQIEDLLLMSADSTLAGYEVERLDS